MKNDNTFKVVDVNTSEVMADGLDFYAGRHLMGDRDDVTMMESDADITERLERRAKLIEVMEGDVYDPDLPTPTQMRAMAEWVGR